MSTLLKFFPVGIAKKFSFTNEKSKVVMRNTIVSFFIKGINIGVNFFTVPLVLSFLNTTQYGIWLTLTAVLTWFSLFDLGFGNGLRNKLVTSLANDDTTESKIYISTTYAALTVIFGSLLVVFWIGNSYINWTKVFNAPVSVKADLNAAVLYAISFLFLQFILRLINTVFLAFQRSAMADMSNAIIQVCILIGLFILKYMNMHSLVAVALVYAVVPVSVFLTLNLVFFLGKYKMVRPSISFVRKGHVKSLLSLGLSFFIIQVASLVIYASDNFIISQLFAPSEVTVYNVAYKYFSIGSLLISIIISPFWSMVTKAYAENDLSWIKGAMRKLSFVWLGLACLAIIQLTFSKPLYAIWTHNKVVVPLSLSMMLCVYYIVVIWGNIFSSFLNGVGKVRLQLYFATVSMIVNIPLAIFFAKVCHLGILSVPLATVTVTTLGSIVTYIQYKKIISVTATGIWNK